MRETDTRLGPLKAVRNAAAAAMASAMFHAPLFERPFARAAFTCRRIPGLHTLFREITDRLAGRLVKAGRQFRLLRFGPVSARFDVSDFTVKGRHFSRLEYERGATTFVLSRLGPGDVFVDIGANTGYFTVLAALSVGPTGRVFAFEPHPDVRARLARHVSINDVADRVVISSVAIGARDEDEVDFFVSCWPENNGISSLSPAPETLMRGGLSMDAKISVAVRQFDTWATAAGLSRIDLIKIDVEGAELDVLSGMAQTLDRLRPRHILCETPRDSEAVRVLRAAGYGASMLDEIPGGLPNLLFTWGER